MFSENDIKNDRELSLQNLTIQAIRELRAGTKNCTDQEHLFLSMNNIHNVICLGVSWRPDGATQVYEISLYARPSAVRSVFDIYENFTRKVEQIRDISTSFQVSRSTDILLTVQVFETVEMDAKRALNHLLECVTHHFHQVMKELVDDKRKRDEQKFHKNRVRNYDRFQRI